MTTDDTETETDESEDWRLTPGEQRFTADPVGPVPPYPDDADVFVVVSGSFIMPLSQADWHSVDVADLPDGVRVRTRTVQPSTETETLTPEEADAIGLPEGAKIPVEQPAEVYDNATFMPGDRMPAELVRRSLWVDNHYRLIPVDEDGEVIEVAEPVPEEPPEPTSAKRALAAYHGVRS